MSPSLRLGSALGGLVSPTLLLLLHTVAALMFLDALLVRVGYLVVHFPSVVQVLKDVQRSFFSTMFNDLFGGSDLGGGADLGGGRGFSI